jgi:aminoglycoside 6-adenylyltransferase
VEVVMRTEQEMLDLILNVANSDDRIRAVAMNGSRTNPNAIRDIFQDYDIVYVVKETKSFRENKHWIDRFGERLYMQYPEDNSYYPEDVENCYGWLMQFSDGNRLDLHVCTLNYVLEDMKKDSLYKVLLDKDDCIPFLPEASDKVYWIKKPSEQQFLDTCNEFWWCLNNVAKGLWREEITYIMDMINYAIRPSLINLLGWEIGLQTDFSVSIGKSGKYMYRWLEEEKWNTFLRTYPSGVIKEIWDSAFIMCELFHSTAKEVAEKMDFKYNEMEAKNSLKFLKDIYLLPKDATHIY